MTVDTTTTNPPATASRREVLTGIAAVPLAAVPFAATPVGGPIVRLIEGHRSAHAALIEAIDHFNAVEAAYETAYETVLVPVLLGGACETMLGNEECAKHIARAFADQRARMKYLSRLAPELGEQVAALLDAKEAENLGLLKEALAKEEADKEAFGLAAATRAYDEKDDAEHEAALKLCAYQCRTIEEAAMKAEYIASSAIRDQMETDHAKALLGSFRPAA